MNHLYIGVFFFSTFLFQKFYFTGTFPNLICCVSFNTTLLSLQLLGCSPDLEKVFCLFLKSFFQADLKCD